MIRINLLDADRGPAKKALGTFETGQKLTVACSLILVAAAVFIGWRYWSLAQQSVRLEQDIAGAQQEKARLQAVIQKVREFEQRKSQLSQRVVLIEDLRKEQNGPVHMLDEISRALPPMLWLTEVKQVPGTVPVVEIAGNSTTQTGVSDFINNLEASGYFRKSIDIIDTKTVLLPQPPGELVTFAVRAQFQTPGEARPSGAAPGGVRR